MLPTSGAAGSRLCGRSAYRSSGWAAIAEARAQEGPRHGHKVRHGSIEYGME